MTYIITVRTKESILMASDTRLNYFNDRIINGERYQEIIAIADCIRKTFFIDKAKIGIQFLGIGYFPDFSGEEYPLSHFIKKLNSKEYSENFTGNVQAIFSFLKKISKKNDTGQYVKGVMSGFNRNKSYICTFNIYNNNLEVKEFSIGQFVDSENNNAPFPSTEAKAVQEINKRINKAAKQKYWNIGGPVEILKITPERWGYIQASTQIFNGTKKELVHHFKNNINKINGKILSSPHYEKYNF